MRVTRVTNASLSRAARSAEFTVIDGPDAGMVVAIPAVGAVVGAGAGADIELSDRSVSGRHVSISPGPNGFTITDLGSRNGTFIDGVAISKATAPPGTVVRIGHTLFALTPADDSLTLPPSEASQFGAMRGTSPAMRQVFAVLERACQSDASILCLGESGTGKELAARAVHDQSPRKDGPFIVFDCGASTENLIESDLFGHVRGAFTGAVSDRDGAFALAHGGTLFLDEIGDLPLHLQPKLLRLLEAGEVIPLGSRKPQRFDVRVVAATHRDLYAEVARGGFRGDLYYRLAVVEVHLPPLRARSGDLPGLIAHFLTRLGRADLAAQVPGARLDRLLQYQWPGNVRELRNVMARAVALAGPNDDVASLPYLLRAAAAEPPASSAPRVRADRPFHEAKEDAVLAFERAYLEDLLEQAGDNLSHAARVAGVERKFLYKLLERTGLRARGANPDGAPEQD